MEKYNSIWALLVEYYKNEPDDLAGKVLDTEILESETILKCRYSSEYRKYLTIYGGGGLRANYIFGLRRSESMPTQLWSVIDNTKFYKETQRWPGIDDWYIISDDGSGNPIGIDPGGRVWLSDHDSDFDKIKLADDFEEFLYRVYTETLFEE